MFTKSKFVFLLILFSNLFSVAHAHKTQLTQHQSLHKIKDVAKTESKSVYHVFGKHYEILGSSKNYRERGIASWYGKAFHQKYTSSGERFNMYKMTAAHKSLPLPTYVQVTNLKNGRQVIVKVNDRGPFIPNRIIDLSYMAAKKLGMVGRGLAPVMVKALS